KSGLLAADRNGSGRNDLFLAEVPQTGSSDTTPPTGSITAPAGGATVSGTSVPVTANASDNVGVAGVQFRLDGIDLGAEDGSAPYSIAWDTTVAANGVHSLTALARDAAGNPAVSGELTLTPMQVHGGLTAYWNLNEGTGTVAADSSGNGNDGTLMNGPAWTAGTTGTGLAFDGVTNYVLIPHAAVLDTFPLSMAIWFKTTTTSGVSGLANKYIAGSANGYQIFFNNGNLCAWYYKDAANSVYDNGGCTMSTPGYNDGAWHQATLVVDAVSGRLYVDGVQKASQPWTGTA